MAYNYSLNLILGGHNSMASISLPLRPIMRSPHQTPAMKVMAVIKTTMTNNTSTVMANQLGSVFTKVAIDSNILFSQKKVMLPDCVNLYSRYPPATVTVGDPVVLASG